MRITKHRVAVALFCLPAVIACLILGQDIAEAGGCRVRVRSSDQVLLVPSYANQGYAFQVGSELQIEAIAERVAARVLAQLAAGQQTQNTTPEAGSEADALPSPAAAPLSLLSQKCAKCHDGTNPDRVQLVGVELSCEQRIEAIRRLLLEPGNAEHMPKGGQLTAEELGDLIGELSGAK